jgi:hypothetical protein
MSSVNTSVAMKNWPDESKEAAQLVIDRNGYFTTADCIAMADRLLADVRAEYGVPPRQL